MKAATRIEDYEIRQAGILWEQLPDAHKIERLGRHYARLANMASMMARVAESNRYVGEELIRAFYNPMLEDYRRTFGGDPTWRFK